MAFVYDGTVARLTERVEALEDQVASIPSTWINVKAAPYGAVGDGTTNDRNAIQAALDAGAGKTVYIPPGDYLIGPTGPGDSLASLRPPSNITIIGSGAGSILRMQAGGWDTLAESGADGMINASVMVMAATSGSTQISNVRITGIHFYGSMTTPDNDGYRYNPMLIGIYRGNRLQIDHCIFENTHYAALWNWGLEADNNDFLFTNNNIYNCCWQEQDDEQGNGGGGSIQFSAVHVVAANNTFRHTGGGLFITGAYNSAIGNTFEDFQGFGVDISENDTIQGSSVVGNTFRTSPSLIPGGLIVIPTAIVATNTSYGLGHVLDNHFLIANNNIHFTLNSTNAWARGISVDQINANVTDNIITFDTQIDTTGLGTRYCGIYIRGGSDYSPVIHESGNMVYVYSSNSEPHFSTSQSFVAYTISSQGTVKPIVYSSHNIANIPSTSSAWSETYSSGYPLEVHHQGDVSISGGIAIGHGTLSERSLPFWVTFDSYISTSSYLTAVSMRNITVGQLTATETRSTKYSNTADLTIFDTDVGQFHRWKINGTTAGHLKTTGFEAVGYRLGSGVGSTFEGPYITYGTDAPSAGTWARGDVVLNSEPSAGGIPGWTCVTAGSPGTWKAWAILAA